MALTEFLVYALAGVLAVTWLGIGYWIYSDASSRGVRAAPLWGIASALFWPVGAYYLVRHRGARKQSNNRMPGTRLAMLLGVSGFVSVIVAELLSSPDGITMALYLLALFPTAFVLLHFTSRRYRGTSPQ
jgi:membrane protease YdiL (CAAX protease family)